MSDSMSTKIPWFCWPAEPWPTERGSAENQPRCFPLDLPGFIAAETIQLTKVEPAIPTGFSMAKFKARQRRRAPPFGGAASLGGRTLSDCMSPYKARSKPGCLEAETSPLGECLRSGHWGVARGRLHISLMGKRYWRAGLS